MRRWLGFEGSGGDLWRCDLGTQVPLWRKMGSSMVCRVFTFFLECNELIATKNKKYSVPVTFQRNFSDKKKPHTNFSSFVGFLCISQFHYFKYQISGSNPFKRTKHSSATLTILLLIEICLKFHFLQELIIFKLLVHGQKVWKYVCSFFYWKKNTDAPHKSSYCWNSWLMLVWHYAKVS